MAIGDEVSGSLDVNLSFNKLLSAFHDLFDECRIMSKKFNCLKKEHTLINNEFEKLKHDNPLLPLCTKC